MACFLGNGQSIISIEEAGNYINDGNPIPDHVREINDLNNLLEPYLGAWKGAYDDKILEIIVFRDRMDGEFVNLSEDRISFTYKILDQNNNLLISSESPGLRSAFGLYYTPYDNSYKLYLRDACRKSKTVYLRPYSDLALGGAITEKMEFFVGEPLMGGITHTLPTNNSCSSVADLLPQSRIVTLLKQ